MRQTLLLLADSRLPAGGHAHSGGIAPAVEAELVGDEATVVEFLRGRLHTAGLLAGAVAARAAALAAASAAADAHAPATGHRPADTAPAGPAGSHATAGPAGPHVPAADARSQVPAADAGPSGSAVDAPPAALGTPPAAGGGGWAELDAEVDARTPAPAQRAVSRSQGRALLRVARKAFPHPLLAILGARPHHPVVLGVAVHIAGGTPEEAAAIAVAGAISGPASAAVRLLGLDPLGLTAAQAGLAREADEVAGEAAGYARKETDALPAPSAPLLDLLAQAHARSEVRLFAS